MMCLPGDIMLTPNYVIISHGDIWLLCFVKFYGLYILSTTHRSTWNIKLMNKFNTAHRSI